MLRLIAPAAALVMMTPISAIAGDANEVGYPEGTLAVQAIAAGNYDAAERVLAPENRADAKDPARLINIGTVYVRTGRMADARAAFTSAKAAPDALLTLSNGQERSSRTDRGHDVAFAR